MATDQNFRDELTPRQRRAIACLILSATIQDAAKSAGIGERTLHTWLKLPDFQAALAKEEGILISNAARRLVALADKSLNTFEAVLDDQEVSPAVKLRAAASVLENLLKLRELSTLEDRVSLLEEAVRSKR